MSHVRHRLTLLALVAGSSGIALAQAALPTSQPALVTIVREQVKTGHSADHAKHEAGWPAAFERSKSPDYYLAFVSMTGPNEAWYVGSYQSHAALGAGMKRDDADPVLSAELARLSRGDAVHINDSRVIHAVARPDLSAGDFPDLGKMRFWEMTIFRVRPGHEAAFAAAAKAYRAAAQRSAPSTRWRLYEVIAGMPGPTYLVFASVASFDEFDRAMADGQKAMAAATPEEGATLEKFSRESLLGAETNRFRLDPLQSYVPKETRASDPSFWMPRKPASRATPQ